MQYQPWDENSDNSLNIEISELVEAVVKAVLVANQTQDLENALAIGEELRRLPDYLMTEVINGVLLQLIQTDPILGRWFILDIFLRDAEAEGKADVAERINLLIADLGGN